MPHQKSVFLTLGRLLGKMFCRSCRVACVRPLHRPKVLFLETGMRTSGIFPLSSHASDTYYLVLIFVDRLCRPDTVASGRGARLSRLSPRKIFFRSKRVACALLRRLKIFSRREKNIFRSTFTNRPCRPDLVASGRSTRLFNSTRYSVCRRRFRLSF